MSSLLHRTSQRPMSKANARKALTRISLEMVAIINASPLGSVQEQSAAARASLNLLKRQTAGQVGDIYHLWSDSFNQAEIERWLNV